MRAPDKYPVDWDLVREAENPGNGRFIHRLLNFTTQYTSRHTPDSKRPELERHIRELLVEAKTGISGRQLS